MWESEREAAKPTQLQTRTPDPFDPKSTRPYLPFSATVSAEQGTKWKLRIFPLFVVHHRRRKPTGTPAIEAWKSAAPPIFVAIDSTGFWWRNRLGFVPHPILCHFWLSTAAGDIVLLLIGRWKTYDFGSSIRSHRRAWKVTTATVGLSVARNFWLELPVQRWLNSNDRCPARAFW